MFLAKFALLDIVRVLNAPSSVLYRLSPVSCLARAVSVYQKKVMGSSLIMYKEPKPQRGSHISKRKGAAAAAAASHSSAGATGEQETEEVSYDTAA